jgi:protein MAK16
VAGKITLEMKTPERAHTPAKLWQKIELPEDVSEGMTIIERELQYWDEWLIEKVKQRYVRIVETLERMRKLRQAPKVKEIAIKRRVEKRTKAREQKALSVAHVDYVTKQELLKRLREGVYGEIYNMEKEEFEEALDEYAEDMEFVDESDLEDVEEEVDEDIEELELA